ncbi:MAG: O-antigen ligase family protein [Opitutales bacterium]|nr:O-antigen ligase family protein [Opitutales bacterium]
MQSSSKSLRFYIVLIISVGLLILLGGGTHYSGLIFTLFLTGGWLLVAPPKRRPGRGLIISIVLFFIWILATAFLPIHGAVVDFLDGSLSGGMPEHKVAVQPLLTLEKVLYPLCCVFWLFMVLERKCSHYDRIKCIQILTWMIGVLGLIALAGLTMKFQHPFTWGTHKFSFFPNHNQQGAIFAIGAILSMGLIIRSIKRREWKIIQYLIIFAVLFLSIIGGMSRSAVLTMSAGCALYFLLTLDKKNTTFYLKLGVPFAMLLLAIFILYGEKLMSEFLSLMGSGGVQQELRILIYLDSLNIVREFPVFGVGLGNFRYFYPMFQDLVGVDGSIFHPESDLLWVWTELGLVGVILVLFIFSLLIIRLDPKDVNYSKGIRLTGFVALLLYLFTFIFEVSSHRIGTALLAVVLYGIIQHDHVKTYSSSILWVFSRLMGLGMLILGGIWTFNVTQHRPFTIEDIRESCSRPLAEQLEEMDPDTLLQKVTEWKKRAPLMYQLHQLEGMLAVYKGEDIERAKKAFDICHDLKPLFWEPMIYHGLYVHVQDYDLAMDYWARALQLSGESSSDVFKKISGSVSKEYYARLKPLTEISGSIDWDLLYRFYLLFKNDPVAFSRQIGVELAINGELNGFSSEQKQTLFWLFGKHSGTAPLKRLMNRFPVLGSENWTLKAQIAEGDQNFREAARLALINLPPEEMIDLTSGRVISAIRTEYLLDSEDPLKLIALVQKQIQTGLYEDAMVTIEVGRNRGVTSDYLNYELAKIYFQLDKPEEAWTIYRKMIENSIRENMQLP